MQKRSKSLWTKTYPIWVACTFRVSGNAAARQLPRLADSSMNEVIKAMALDEKIDLLADAGMEWELDNSTLAVTTNGKKSILVTTATGGMELLKNSN